MPRRRLWYSAKKLKREFAYQTFIETIAGNHIECELKAVMDFIHYGLFEASKEKDYKAFSGIPLFCFNKQWLIIRVLFHMKRTQSIPSLLPLVENRTSKLSPRVEFKPRRRLWYCTKTLKENSLIRHLLKP